MLEDSPDFVDFFAAGRAAAARGWYNAVLVTGRDVLDVTPAGPPVVLVVDGAEVSVQEAKALAAASGAGRRILLLIKGSPIDPQALAWMGESVATGRLSAPAEGTAQPAKEPAAAGSDDASLQGAADESGSGAEASAAMSGTSPPSSAHRTDTAEDQGVASADHDDRPSTPASDSARGDATANKSQRSRRLALAAGAVVALSVLVFGIWRVAGSQEAVIAPTPQPSSPASEGGAAEGTDLIDTEDAERESARYLATEYDAPVKAVTVDCPSRVTVGDGRFSCSWVVDHQGVVISGDVKYRLVEVDGDVLTLRATYE